MTDIYRRYNNTHYQPPVNLEPSTGLVAHHKSQTQHQPTSESSPPTHDGHKSHRQTQTDCPKSDKKAPSKSKPTASNFMLNMLPKNIYNPETGKILGFLSAEDLLLIALIFLFLEDSSEDNPLMVLALVYVLLSDYIDFGEFSF